MPTRKRPREGLPQVYIAGWIAVALTIFAAFMLFMVEVCDISD